MSKSEKTSVDMFAFEREYIDENRGFYYVLIANNDVILNCS